MRMMGIGSDKSRASRGGERFTEPGEPLRDAAGPRVRRADGALELPRLVVLPVRRSRARNGAKGKAASPRRGRQARLGSVRGTSLARGTAARTAALRIEGRSGRSGSVESRPVMSPHTGCLGSTKASARPASEPVVCRRSEPFGPEPAIERRRPPRPRRGFRAREPEGTPASRFATICAEQVNPGLSARRERWSGPHFQARRRSPPLGPRRRPPRGVGMDRGEHVDLVHPGLMPRKSRGRPKRDGPLRPPGAASTV